MTGLKAAATVRAMIPRYTPPDFAELWSPATRYATWLSVELAACEAMEADGLVPAGTARSLRDKRLALDPDRIDAIERTVKHDVIAFLTHVEELAGPEARFLHRGMTSSDVLGHAAWRFSSRRRPTSCSAAWTRSPPRSPAAPRSTGGRR